MKLLKNKRLLFVLAPLMAIYAFGLWFILGHGDATEYSIPTQTMENAVFSSTVILSLHKEDEITLVIDEISLTKDEHYEPDHDYCIDTALVSVYEHSKPNNEALKNIKDYFDGKLQDPVCFIENGFALRPNEKFTFPLHGDVYNYPYDNLNISFNVTFFGHNKQTSNMLVNTNVNYVLDYTGRDLDGTDVFPVGFPSANFIRPLVYRLLTPMLIFCIFVFIPISLFIKDIGAFCQVTVAMLFGLWGVKQIIVPFNPNQIIFIDNIFLALYMLLGLIVIAWILHRSISQYQEQAREDQQGNCT